MPLFVHACACAPLPHSQMPANAFKLCFEIFFFNSDNFPGFYSAEFIKCTLFSSSWISRGNFQNDSGGIISLMCFFQEICLPPHVLNVLPSPMMEVGKREHLVFFHKIIGNLLLTTCSLYLVQVPGYRCLNWMRNDCSGSFDALRLTRALLWFWPRLNRYLFVEQKRRK